MKQSRSGNRAAVHALYVKREQNAVPVIGPRKECQIENKRQEEQRVRRSHTSRVSAKPNVLIAQACIFQELIGRGRACDAHISSLESLFVTAPLKNGTRQVKRPLLGLGIDTTDIFADYSQADHLNTA